MNLPVKKFLPILFAFLLVIPAFGQAQVADDITGHHHEKELKRMVESGYMNGYGNGIYKPDAPVTRGQFAAIIARALHLEEPEEGIVFTDVNEQTGVMDEVLAAAGAGLITGYDDGTFKPNIHISRQHMAVIIDRAMNYMDLEKQTSALTFKDKSSIIYPAEVGNTVAYGIIKGSTKSDGVYFRPNDNATRGDAAAVVSRLLDAIEAGEDEIPPVEGEKPDMPFSTATIQADGSTKIVSGFTSYENAIAGLKDGQVIQYGDTIIKMPGGIIVTKPTVASSLTNIYTSNNLKTAETYVSADTELEYVSSTDKYVEVKVAGKKGFIKHENSILLPWKAVKERSYYSSAGGELTHHIYLNNTSRYVSYIAGKAPSFMIGGAKYYSWDGVNFHNSSGSKVGTGNQYFQYLPARSVSKYTADEIDQYIMKELKRLEATNLSTYKDASKKSKLIGLGTYLKKVEKEKKVNALLILALAQHESAYGLSARAQEYNNLFGLKVYDDRPVAEHFETVEDNIDELLNSYLNKNYIPPNAAYANGAVFGNKAMGFNMKYASDPYWGAKAAGHWYRIDKAMGGAELKDPYKIGLTTDSLNIRVDPGTNHSAAFKYNKIGLPVIILAPATPAPWVKIVSDSASYTELYAHGSYIKEIPVIK